MGALKTVLRNVVFLVVLAIGIGAAWVLLYWLPETTRELLAVVLLLLLAPVVLKLASDIASSVVPAYNVAEVAVSGPITRDVAASPLQATPVGASANALVEEIDRADADGSVDALLVRLNTPGGEIVPSEDIKLAVERFDGPTVAYATDTCASGGYEIASGCDEIWAREGSIVGSIGVIGSRVTVADLAEQLGVEYEQLTAGEFKDAGTPLKELEPDEREYLQGLVDDYYDTFVSNVAQRRDLAEADIEDTEARVYLGREAHDIGLVDEIGTREAVEDRLEELLGKSPAVREFAPQFGLTRRLGASTQRLAYAFGAGFVSALTGEGDRFRLR